ncbi:MAG: RNA polymerase sigma factor RpoE [Candidatus Doudnabacteria bacterium]
MDSFSDEFLALKSITDPESFNLLLVRHRQPLLVYISRNFTRDNDSAEDIVQLAFMKAFLNLKKFDRNKKFKTWLYKIAINSAKTFLARPPTLNLDDCILIGSTTASREVVQQLENIKLERALRKIGFENSEIIKLYYFGDLSYKEISLKLKIPAYSIRARIRYAESVLKRKYYIES